MRRIRILGVGLLAVLALGAALASSGSAAPNKPLTMKAEEEALKNGAKLTKKGQTVVTAGGRSIECAETTFGSTLTTNGLAKDKGTLTEASFAGEGDGACVSGLGPASITASDLPWPTEISSKGTVTIKGTKKVAFTVTFTGQPGEPKCTLEASKFVSTFTPGEAGKPIPMVLTASDQTFKLNKKVSAASCAKDASVSGIYDVTSEGKVVTSEL
jgi:hypothetical protein